MPRNARDASGRLDMAGRCDDRHFEHVRAALGSPIAPAPELPGVEPVTRPARLRLIARLTPTLHSRG
jgi:hypothetical protein